MKVIMLSDVRNVGKKGEVKEVADGYATNFLIHKGLAVAVSKGSMAVLNKQQEDAKEKEAEAVKEAEALKERIEKLKLCFDVKTGKEGKAFGSVSTKQITEHLQKAYGITVDKRKFLDTASLDTLGFHNVRVELHKGVVAALKIQLKGIE